jgi:hypothetical protein
VAQTERDNARRTSKNGSKHGFDEGQALKLPSWLLSAAGAARPPAWSDNPAMLKKFSAFQPR